MYSIFENLFSINIVGVYKFYEWKLIKNRLSINTEYFAWLYSKIIF